MIGRYNITTIFKLVREGKTLFLDTGVLSGEKDIQYRRTIDKARKFKDLDKRILKLMLYSLDRIRQVCEDDSLEVYTIPEVIRETRFFRAKIRRKFKNLKLQLIAEATSSYTQGKKELFRSIIEYQSDIVNILSGHYFDSQIKVRPIFSHLEKLVINVGEKIGVKEKHEDRRGEDYMNTDEKLVASAIYHSVINGKSSNILARDRDIGKLLHGSVSSMILSGRYRGLVNSFLENPVTVYYCDDGDFQKECDTAHTTKSLIK